VKIFTTFLKSTSGNFSTMFAIACIPLFVAAGVALDYSRLSQQRTQLQNAVDAAALSVGNTFVSMEQSEIEKEVDNYLQANLDQSHYEKLIKPINVAVDKEKHALDITVNSSMDTSLMMLAGINEVGYASSSQIIAPFGGVEISMVLDNTFSMSDDNKLIDLKSAAASFIDIILAPNSAAKIAIVPFSNHVNVGLDFRGESWLEVADDSTTTDPNVCYNKVDIKSTSNCRDETGYNDGVAYTYQQCDYVYSEPYEVCGPRTTVSKWNGCVGSREYPLNLQDKEYDIDKIPGLMNTMCGAPITPLTDSKLVLKSQIDTMVASGATYIPTGLTWGMRLLSSKAPFSEGSSSSQASIKKIKKILILMTDGDNQKSAQLPSAPSHWGSNLDQANDWTNEACNEIKSENIEIYSITFGPISDKTKSIIKNCASDTGKYFHAIDGSQLKTVFETMASQIGSLRLAM
jgi:hypothetical protein